MTPGRKHALTAALAAEIAVVVCFAIVYNPFDLNVYLWGGHAITGDARLYLDQVSRHWFTYPPFAAMLMMPLASLPQVLARVGWELATVAALAWSCLLTLRLAGRRRPSRLVLAGVLAGALTLEPVYHTLFLGQVNVLLLALILTDVWLVSGGWGAGRRNVGAGRGAGGGRGADARLGAGGTGERGVRLLVSVAVAERRDVVGKLAGRLRAGLAGERGARLAGIGVGVAAAIKLTPAIFIVWFLLARRPRAALTAAGTFGCCGLLGYLVAPAASRLYWTRLFDDTGRVSGSYLSNQSPYGTLSRVLGGVSQVGGWYVIIPLVIGAAGLAVAAVLARRGDWLGGAAVTGVTGLLVSPVSWTHHWVWILPALFVLARHGSGGRIAAGCGYALFALGLPWWTPHSGGPHEYGWHGLLTMAANSYLLAGLAFVAYMGTRVVLDSRRRAAGAAGRAGAATGDRDASRQPAPAAAGSAAVAASAAVAVSPAVAAGSWARQAPGGLSARR
ncbi:MAG TPA: glycosyltransferase 87 family protein [Streptosporangiaceae bacterium]|nr:glycosyltransferase 87 family protein [Streptosporangiaceae bacterium]